MVLDGRPRRGYFAGMSLFDPATKTAVRHYGKYRGTVVNNLDPMLLGRITAFVPDVPGMLPQTWAMPCLPYVKPGATPFALPPVGHSVWIEFEQGNIDFPIWSGVFWTSAEPSPFS